MTSRQPDATPPGTAGHAAIPAAARHRLVSAPRWPVLVLALLIVVGLAGLRGGVTGLAWDGPLHGDAVAVGLALEIVLGILLVITIRRLATRARAGTVNAVALVFLGAVVFRLWWARRFGSSGSIRTYHYYAAPDSQDLLEVVESGQWALRAIDDARAAIIACYVAMEASLAEHGAARAIADTPEELLTRATAMGIVRGTAAARLTALFYEARFSSHPLDRGQREAAGQALADLAAALAGAEAAGAEAAGAEAAGAEAAGTQAGRRRAKRTGARR